MPVTNFCWTSFSPEPSLLTSPTSLEFEITSTTRLGTQARDVPTLLTRPPAVVGTTPVPELSFPDTTPTFSFLFHTLGGLSCTVLEGETILFPKLPSCAESAPLLDCGPCKGMAAIGAVPENRFD
ncbi:hypothetical protein ACOSQ4_014197 [Xanthoceras sorbifolium]